MGYGPIDELPSHLREALRLVAHHVTESELAHPGATGPLAPLAPRTLNHRVEELYRRLVEAEPDQLLAFVQRLGLVPEPFRRRLASEEGWPARKRRELLACLYWAHAAATREGAPEAEVVNWDLPVRLGLPVVVLDADLRPEGGWRHGTEPPTVVCERVDAPSPQLPDAFLERVWALVTAAHPTATSAPTLFGLRAYRALRASWDDRAVTGVWLGLSPTDFRLFKATNAVYQLDDPGLVRQAWALGLGQAELADPTDLPASRLANPLSVAVVALARDRYGVEWLGVQRRHPSQTAGAPYAWGATTAAYVSVAHNRQDAPVPGGPPDPFLTVCREFGEEVGTFDGRSAPITPADVVFTALVREVASAWEPALVGEVHLPFPFEQLADLKPGVDAYFEGAPAGRTGPVLWVRATPEAVASWMWEQRAGFPTWTPLGLAAVLIALVRRHPLRVIAHAFAELRRRFGEHPRMPDRPWGPPQPHAPPARVPSGQQPRHLAVPWRGAGNAPGARRRVPDRP
jgi:hypothetical protein